MMARAAAILLIWWLVIIEPDKVTPLNFATEAKCREVAEGLRQLYADLNRQMRARGFTGHIAVGECQQLPEAPASTKRR